MGTITIKEDTSKDPITMVGIYAAICYGSDTTNSEKNYKRGINCIKSNHGRTLEFPQIYMEIDGYSARVARELYTHIGGAPTRIQESTRYMKYGEVAYVTPPAIKKNEDSLNTYETIMEDINDAYHKLIDLGISKEDAANVLPLGMTTKVILRTNLRQLIDMSKVRMCGRAYPEFQKLMYDMTKALSEYSDEWNAIVNELKAFHPKCEDYGYCPEECGCGRYPKRKK